MTRIVFNHCISYYACSLEKICTSMHVCLYVHNLSYGREPAERKIEDASQLNLVYISINCKLQDLVVDKQCKNNIFSSCLLGTCLHAINSATAPLVCFYGQRQWAQGCRGLSLSFCDWRTHDSTVLLYVDVFHTLELNNKVQCVLMWEWWKMIQKLKNCVACIQNQVHTANTLENHPTL